MGAIVDHAIGCSHCAHELRAARQVAVAIGEIESSRPERAKAAATMALGALVAGLHTATVTVKGWLRVDQGKAWLGVESAGGGRIVSRRPAVAAAGLIAASVVGVLLVLSPGAPSVSPVKAHRDRAAPIVRPWVLPGQALPRDHFELRWQGLPEARYDLRVMTADLDEIAVVSDLEVPVFRLEEHELAGLEPGTKLLWQVDAYLPDGERIPSGTHEVRLE